MRQLLILMTILLSGCITHGPMLRPHQKLFYQSEKVSNMTIYFKYDVNEKEKMLIMEAIELQSNVWMGWNQRDIQPVRVYVFRGTSIPCGQRVGRFSGAYFVIERDIHVTMGSRYEVPSIYHELTHHMLNDTDERADTNHEGEIWKSVTEKQGILRSLLWHKRKLYDFSRIYWGKAK